MPQCPFCKNKEEQVAPICQSCGSLKYPVDNGATVILSRQKKIKYSVALAATIFIPGTLFALALAGIPVLYTKIKNTTIMSLRKDNQ